MAKASKNADSAPKKGGAPTNTPSSVSQGPIIQGETVMEWRANPWQTQGRKLAALLGIMFIMMVVVAWVAPDMPILLLILPLMLVGRNAPDLFPSHYILTTEGIYWGNFVSRTFKSWKAFKRVATYGDTMELLYDPANLRNRILRGIMVYYNDNRDEVTPTIKRLWAAHNPDHEGKAKEA